METGILLLCLGLGLGALIISFAFAHRLISETRIKEKVFQRSFSEERSQEVKVDELASRLEEFRNQRFGRSMVGNPDIQASITSRIKAEENAKRGV